MRTRLFSLFAMGLFLSTAVVVPVAASPWSDLVDTTGARPVHQLTHPLPAEMQRLALQFGGPDFYHPGAFVDALVWSADVAPYDVDPGVRLGTFLWNALASGDFWGVDEYQKAPFIEDVAATYNCVMTNLDPICYMWSHDEQCDAWGTYGPPSWENFEAHCPRDRFDLITYGVLIILYFAQRCLCLDSPQGVAAFERVVTQGLGTEDLSVFLAKALLPGLWVPALQQAARSYGLTAAGEVADGVPLLFPTLVTQVMTLYRTLLAAEVVDGPGLRGPVEGLHVGESTQQPPGEGPGADGGAGDCLPYVWWRYLPRTHGDARFQLSSTVAYFFHYKACTAYVPDQYLLAVDVSHPSYATSHEAFPVTSFATTTGTAPDGHAGFVCPDNHTWGCEYRTELTEVYVTDDGGHLSLTGQSRTNLRLGPDPRGAGGAAAPSPAAPELSGPGADFTWSEDQMWNAMKYISALICGGILALPVTHVLVVVAKGVCLTHWVGLGADGLSRLASGSNGEEASGVRTNGGPALHAYQDVVHVAVHPDSSSCATIRAPTWSNPTGKYACGVPLHRRADFSLTYPSGATSVRYPSLTYHAVQTSSLRVVVEDA